MGFRVLGSGFRVQVIGFREALDMYSHRPTNLLRFRVESLVTCVSRSLYALLGLFTCCYGLVT